MTARGTVIGTARGTGRGATAIGVAIGRHRVVARSLDGAGTRLMWERDLNAEGSWRDQLTAALRALRQVAQGGRELHITLLPPLAEVRITDLPSVPPSRLRATVARDAAKYFPVARESRVVQVQAAGREDGSFAPHTVSAAPATVVDDVLAAAAAAGWNVASIAAAQFAWARGAATLSRSNGGRVVALFQLDESSELFDITAGTITGVRRFRAVDTIPAAFTATTYSTNDADAADFAARFSDLTDDHSLWPDRVYAARERAKWRSAGWYLTAALGLLLATAIVEWVAAGQQLSSAKAERAAIRSQVSTVIAARDSLNRITSSLAGLRQFSAEAPRWSGTITALTKALPLDAALNSLRASGDTVTMVGDAEHAATVFSALAQSPAFSGVRAQAPIQQQTENGEVVSERFLIAVQLVNRKVRAPNAPMSAQMSAPVRAPTRGAP